MTNWQYDVAIVGAGIVGTACADELSRRGLRVAIFDISEAGAGATLAAMGHIVVLDDSEAQFILTRYSQTLWQKLRPALPRAVEYNACGTIWIAADAEEMEAFLRKYDYYAARGVPARVLSAEELRHEEPELRSGLVGGLLIPEDVVVAPPAACKFFLDGARKQGADLIADSTVTAIGNHTVCCANGKVFTARIIVNAAGSAAGKLTPGIAIQSRKGHLSLTDSYPGFLKHQLVELGYLKSAHSISSDSVAFNVQPRPHGQVLVGSSRQYGSESPDVEREILNRMLHRACDYMPKLAEMKILRSWTGFRAATPDKIPLIGPWEQDDSILLATGHEGLGITTSLATAQLIADFVTGSASQIPGEPYLPSRITQRELPKQEFVQPGAKP